MDPIPDEVLRHYAGIDEGARITVGLGQLEFVRVQEIVQRFLPKGLLEIADVGGGKGVHAAWLADLGHRVHLIDVVPGHVEAANVIGGQVTAQLGDARSLPFDDESMDAVLVFGPLYHLTERQDRLRALAEARRVARPGAPIFVAGVSRFASLFDGLARKMIFDASFREVVKADLRDGQHRNPIDHPRWFTTAFFHHPNELRDEATTAGLDVAVLLGVEGMGEWLPGLAEEWASPEGREEIAWAARMIEAEPALAGLSSHLLLVGHRPAQ
jgi:ubiquinone/menaquinone biosynthesis C-methylase UbiE